MTKENSLKQRIHRGEIPRYIYNYTSLLKKNNNLESEQSHIWENLKQNSLYFSRPKDFNDPFDSVAHFSKTSIVNLLSGINTEKILDKNVNPKKLSLEFCNILKTIQGVLTVPHFLGHFQCVNFFDFLFECQSKFLWS